ncbi:MAG: dissimilatory sulfite reductase D family protein [Desulfobacterales bacterium]|nr:dissimilatory sulfite reductase D family protein [Desulfobacterales bacterium]
MDKESAKTIIVDGLTKKSKSKSKFYMSDFYEMFPESKPREVKKIVDALVMDGTLEYWSSGSTTMVGLKGAGKQAAAEEGGGEAA